MESNIICTVKDMHMSYLYKTSFSTPVTLHTVNIIPLHSHALVMQTSQTKDMSRVWPTKQPQKPWHVDQRLINDFFDIKKRKKRN